MEDNKPKCDKDDKLSTAELIALLAVYESEFEHRDKILYSRIYHFFYISIIIMLCPFVSIGGVSLKLEGIPPKCFIVAGMVCEVLAFFICILHADRLDKSSKTYVKVIKMLPSQYRRIPTLDSDNNPPEESQLENKGFKKKVMNIWRRITNTKLTYVVPILFLFASLSIGVVLLHYE